MAFRQDICRFSAPIGASVAGIQTRPGVVQRHKKVCNLRGLLELLSGESARSDVPWISADMFSMGKETQQVLMC
jgi:hypothetical protein